MNKIELDTAKKVCSSKITPKKQSVTSRSKSRTSTNTKTNFSSDSNQDLKEWLQSVLGGYILRLCFDDRDDEEGWARREKDYEAVRWVFD